MGYALAAFMLAYGLFEVPTGRWGDRYGSRGVLTRIVIWWSAVYRLDRRGHGTVDAGGRAVSVRRRRGGGLSQRGAGARPLVSASQRGMAQGLMLTAAQIGAAVAPPVASC